MKYSLKIYSTLFWLSLLSILIWVILKIIGVINTPPLIEWFPVIVAIFGAGVFYQEIMNKFGKLENTTNKTQEDIEFMKSDINSLDKRVGILEVEMRDVKKLVSK